MATSKSLTLLATKRIPYTQLRALSSRTSPRQTSYAAASSDVQIQSESESKITRSPAHKTTKAPALAILPLWQVVRSLGILTVSSSNFLLNPSLWVMSKLAHANNRFLDADRNPLLKFLIKVSIYKQFCAGENAKEVNRTIDGLKELGYTGTILAYAKEVVVDKEEVKKLKALSEEQLQTCIREEIEPWKAGTLETVRLAQPGDFVGLKFTGAGKLACFELYKNIDPSTYLEQAITEVCDLAAQRGIKLLFDAENNAIQTGIDSWTIKYMKKYNNRVPGDATIYGTYQAYLKACPSVVASHLKLAHENGFTLGVKLVRGAYLHTDERSIIHDTKADTDNCYDGISEALIRRSWNSVLSAPEGTPFPEVNVVLASHNQASVEKAQKIHKAQAEAGKERIPLVYAQLQGMADEVSCELLQGREVSATEKTVDTPAAYKYLVWGTAGECMKYLLRRAEENRDAVQRTREGRDAMAGEVTRRVKAMFGLKA